MHDSLNPQQREAVFHKDGALLILAGAGAGKTRVVTHRIAELIRNGVPPEKILAVTFTNKAAQEMKERVGAIIRSEQVLSPYESSRAGRSGARTAPFISTFHALSLHIIKTFHREAGLPKRFSIFDRSDSTKAAKKALEQAGFDPTEVEIRRVLSVMGRAKGDALSVEAFRDERASSYSDEAIAEVWEKYDAILKKEKALDFDDILLRAHQLLGAHKEARDFFQNEWSHLHVDEYQDTNRVQYALIKTLSDIHGNVCAVGDADQNIYSWRGASLEHILNFEKDFPNAHTVLLTENYRSTKTIIQAANDAIAKNSRRKEKELFTKNADGERIAFVEHLDEMREAAFVAGECGALLRTGFAPTDIAVLYRANFQSRVLEEAFLGSGIPYRVLGTRFFERKEVKDTLSYIRLALNPESTTDLARIMNVPARGIGKVTLAKVVNGEVGALNGTQQKKVADFFAFIERLRTALATKKVSAVVRMAVTESGMWSAYKEGKGADEERLENLQELVTVATKYDVFKPEEGLDKFLEEALLQSDQDELLLRQEKKDTGAVTLMTIHASKGLEFPVVFITGMEEGLFPHERDASETDDEEEERRLFYVALTRAKKKVYLTYAMSRRIFGTRSLNMPSTFVTEMDPALADTYAYTEKDDREEEVIL